MIKILRILSVLLFCVMVLFTGCSLFDSIPTKKELTEKAVKVADDAKKNIAGTAVEKLNSFFDEFHDKGELNITEEELSKIIVNCFSDKDTNTLKKAFCQKTQELSDVDEQIRKGFDLFTGKVISYDIEMGYEGYNVEYGKTTFLERSWTIKEIKTDANRSYELYLSVYFTDNDKKKVGISQISITDDHDNKYEIGYKWPSYYNVGSDLSIKIVNMLDDRDKAGLKALLCKKTLQAADIDKQIEEAFDFYKGIAIAGKVNDKDIIYDGRHDYHADVSDDEVVINNKPVSTYIETHVSNIETSAGKTYEMDFYAYLLCENDEARKGISQIIITSNKGEKHIIGEQIK